MTSKEVDHILARLEEFEQSTDLMFARILRAVSIGENSRQQDILLIQTMRERMDKLEQEIKDLKEGK